MSKKPTHSWTKVINSDTLRTQPIRRAARLAPGHHPVSAGPGRAGGSKSFIHPPWHSGRAAPTPRPALMACASILGGHAIRSFTGHRPGLRPPSASRGKAMAARPSGPLVHPLIRGCPHKPSVFSVEFRMEIPPVSLSIQMASDLARTARRSNHVASPPDRP